MLKLRRGVVVETDPLTVEVAGERRRAWSDPALHERPEIGDEVVVNTVAVDLALGSGGFDVVHVNLTRGLQGAESGKDHVIKLNYSSLQHPVAPIEALRGEYAFADESTRPAAQPSTQGSLARPAMRVLVLPLHGHLAPAAYAAAAASPDLKVGFIQAGGGALPGALSRDVARLIERGLLRGHVTVGSSYGGGYEAITLAGGLDAASSELAWDLALVGPGPGILGSATRLGHGGLAALDAAHTALALGLPTVISPRLSAADPRPRHRGLSHHSTTVLELLLAPVTVALPEGQPGIAAQVKAIRAPGGQHLIRLARPDLDGYTAAGLPQRTMGRDLDEDRLFFEAPLAAGNIAAGAEIEPR